MWTQKIIAHINSFSDYSKMYDESKDHNDNKNTLMSQTQDKFVYPIHRLYNCSMFFPVVT